MHPVFEIAFLEEQIPHADETLWDTDNIISRYQIAEMSTGESLGSTIFIIFAELGRFSKSAEECLTVKDKVVLLVQERILLEGCTCVDGRS